MRSQSLEPLREDETQVVPHCIYRGLSYAPIIRGSAPGAYIPLGPFARLSGLKLAGIPAPGAIIDAFVRDRATSAVLVDDVELLDEASLFVVTQLIAVDDLPVILATRDLNQAPADLQHLYDSEDLIEIAVEPLSDDEARTLIASHLEGDATPRAEAEMIAVSEGNPLHPRGDPSRTRQRIGFRHPSRYRRSGGSAS